MHFVLNRRAWTCPALILVVACADGLDDLPTTPPVTRAENYSDWTTPVNLGPRINTPFLEQQPTLSRDGLTLYFASARLTDPTDVVSEQNIWVSTRACTDYADPACAWNDPAPLGPAINGPYFDVTPALSRDEHYLYFGSQRARANCPVEPCDRDVWVSYREDVHDDFAWGEPINLGAGVNGSGEDLAPGYFENDDGGAPQLFFTRGLLADAQLFVSHMLPDGTWGPASPIAELNVDGFADARPSVTHDGLEIYYWSNRGGSAQVYHATRETTASPWSAPELVPSPIADAPSQVPFIHSRGNTESLYFTRTIPGASQDIYVSQRTRVGH